MATLDQDTIEVLAREFAAEYLLDGIEFMSVVENLPSYEEDSDDEDADAIHSRANSILVSLSDRIDLMLEGE